MRPARLRPRRVVRRPGAAAPMRTRRIGADVARARRGVPARPAEGRVRMRAHRPRSTPDRLACSPGTPAGPRHRTIDATCPSDDATPLADRWPFSRRRTVGPPDVRVAPKSTRWRRITRTHHCPETTDSGGPHATLVRTSPSKLHVPRHAAGTHLRPAPRTGPDRRGRGLRPHLRDGPSVPDPRRRPGHRSDARGLVDAGRSRARDDTAATRDPRDRRDLSEPGPAGEDRDDARRHLRWSSDPGHRRGVERRRARRLRLRVPARP